MKKQRITSKKLTWLFLIIGFCLLTELAIKSSQTTFAQSGVLMPGDGMKANQKILALAKMNVDINIDNNRATVNVTQIFDNLSPQILEGKYNFALPKRATISDFAVWDNDLRIPGVMMERKRATSIYEAIKQQQIDPGILQSMDDSIDESGFSVKIFPIPAFGTKRLEIEYTEDIPIEDLTSHFSFPLKPSFGEVQTITELNIKLRVANAIPFSPINKDGTSFPLTITTANANEFIGEFHGQNIVPAEDFSFDYQSVVSASEFSVIAYREPEKKSAFDVVNPNLNESSPDGFFQATAVFQPEQNAVQQPRHLILLLDTSLSMYGDKLSRAVEAIDYFLHNLGPADEFNLILFNDQTTEFADAPRPATTENVEAAMQFIKNSYLSGGTNIHVGLQTAIEQAKKLSGGEPQIIFISDANATRETIKAAKIAQLFDNSNVRLFSFALGANYDETLLKALSEKTDGYFEAVRETDDIAVQLQMFFSKIGTSGISGLRLASDENLYNVYASRTNSFFGSSVAFVGRYKHPQTQTFNLSATSGATPIAITRQFSLPENDNRHASLPRVWARARVDALLQEINENGEKEDLINEVIRLSEKYKFVTPYTAFLAAPRALLRPRLIQPGDPVIRVKTDDSIKEVFAVLPFGKTLPLKFLKDENVWETRFLAPVWMTDGTYKCRLLLTDNNGTGYGEEKTFVIDSKAPSVKTTLAKQVYQSGENVELSVAADSDTIRLIANIYGSPATQLRWSDRAKTNTGTLRLSNNLAAGSYVISVTAEDVAHNQTTEEIRIRVQ